MKFTIERIVEFAAAVAEPEEIILFGSMAAGTANVHSDIDLLIISDSGIHKKEVIARIRNFAEQYGLKADILFYSTPEFAQEQMIPNSFVSAIYQSGKLIYKKGGINLEKIKQ